MRALLAVVMVCTVCAQPSLAATNVAPGLHRDPGSPASKEYRIPISSTRNETSGHDSSNPESSTAPTFGAGVTPARSRTAPAPGSGAAARAHKSAGPHHGHKPDRTASGHAGRNARRHAGHDGSAGRSSSPAITAARQAQVMTAVRAQAGSGSWLPLVAGGALVLLVGCGAGLALKRAAWRRS